MLLACILIGVVLLFEDFSDEKKLKTVEAYGSVQKSTKITFLPDGRLALNPATGAYSGRVEFE